MMRSNMAWAAACSVGSFCWSCVGVVYLRHDPIKGFGAFLVAALLSISSLLYSCQNFSVVNEESK